MPMSEGYLNLMFIRRSSSGIDTAVRVSFSLKKIYKGT